MAVAEGSQVSFIQQLTGSDQRSTACHRPDAFAS